MNIKLINACLAGLMLTGCFQLLPDPGNRPGRVDLKILSGDISPQIGEQKLSSIKINIPTCPDSLNSRGISIQHDQNGVLFADYLAGVEWKEPLPLLVQQKLLQLINATRYFETVGLQSEKFKAYTLLQIHIQRFEIETTDQAGEQGCLEMIATLTRQADHKVLAQQTFKIKIPVSRKSLQGFLQTFDQCFQQFQQEFVNWLVDSNKIAR